ncbi:hypothetical protein N44_00925 [Microcystis aeruginosa NIES-44]|uniref:Uncharacterized protein n=1 Tax=Microcystis aeruginosa NIES-44 TaxID=449439 RepID=A0A0A1VRE3_MICAE|nr:hypothetical protein N44_00925 [Microcystis aeruginosa NIES-44]
MATSKLVKPYTPHPTPPMSGGLGGPHPAPTNKLFQQTLLSLTN